MGPQIVFPNLGEILRVFRIMPCIFVPVRRAEMSGVELEVTEFVNWERFFFSFPF